jgi:2-methylcitrate dehydratase PrpD
MSDRSLTEELSRWLIRRRDNGFPAHVLSTARGFILDWLGSALAGGATNPGKKILDYGSAQSAGPCSLIGIGLACSAEVAAFVNGCLSHMVEMDDIDRGSVVHPGAVVIPAALAIAERERATGKAFLSAVVAGYEVAIRLGEAVGKRHYYYFHNTGTCGVFGAAAAAGWLLGLTEKQFVSAFGNAGTQAAGLWEFNTEGDMSKHLHAGKAAANGVLAADLARRGFTGARRILEGERGLFAATAPGANPTPLSDLWSLDHPEPIFKIGGVSIKPHASCRHTHAAVDAALELRTRLDRQALDSPGTSNVLQVHVDAYQAALDLCDNPNPETPYAAKFSLQYCVAAALTRSRVGLAEFTPEAIASAGIRSILPRISATLEPDFEARYPAEWPARVRLELAGGPAVSATVANPKGDPENPLTPQELADKFRDLAAYAGHAAQADNMIRWVNSFEAERPFTYGSVSSP